MIKRVRNKPATIQSTACIAVPFIVLFSFFVSLVVFCLRNLARLLRDCQPPNSHPGELLRPNAGKLFSNPRTTDGHPILAA